MAAPDLLAQSLLNGTMSMFAMAIYAMPTFWKIMHNY
jgi:hypothetical protein